VTLSVTNGTLSAGTYSTTVTITAPGATSRTVPVTFTLAAAGAPPAASALGVSPASLSFAATVGVANPAPQTLSISNTGSGTLTWTASDNASWLTLSPASGTGNGVVTLSAINGTLSAGTYSTTVTITAPGATSRTVPVTFTLAAAAGAPPAASALGASPASLSFAATVGVANPAPQTLSISNTGSGTLTWTASDNASWLTLSPASGTGNGVVTLSAINGTLSAGTYSTTVTITAPGATSRTVPVTFTLAAAAGAPPAASALGASPASLSFTATIGWANPVPQTLSISNTGSNMLTWTASDNASWLTLSPASGTGNGAVTLSVTNGTLSAGTYSTTVTVTAPGATPRTVPVTFTLYYAGTSTPTRPVTPGDLVLR
jgi:DNA-binding transcriptional regulator YdaS (Cro superfamily)